MRYYVETQTWRANGTEFWTRIRVESYDEALGMARAIAETGFHEQINPTCDYQLSVSPMFQNDYGEMCTVRATKYGDAAQVREGAFII